MIVRNVLVLLLIIPPAIILMTTMLMSSQLRRFQRTVPVLHTADDLQRLRRLVKTQMYASLICLALLAAPLMVWLLGFFIAGALGWLDLLVFVALPFAVVTVATVLMGRPAEVVRATSVANPTLQAERDQIVQVWVDRIFPDW
jgi:hypothetical protein